MNATIQNGQLVITIPLSTPEPSKSGKTLIVASTHGNLKSSCVVDGKPLTISVNAYIPR